MNYSQRINIPSSKCTICGELVTLEYYPRSGLRKFWADTGETHECSSKPFVPWTENSFAVRGVQPVRKDGNDRPRMGSKS